MDMVGHNTGRDSSAGFMGDDELQVGYRGKWIPSVEDVLPCKALLLSCGSRNHI